LFENSTFEAPFPYLVARGMLVREKNRSRSSLCKTKHRKTMKPISLYTDEEIVAAILDRNAFVTREFLYKKCYPLFKARYDKYYTDCENCVEFINEIYLYIMTPGEKTGTSYLSTFSFRCSFTLWLKIVAENYCRKLYKRRMETIDDANLVEGDRNIVDVVSPNLNSLDKVDVEVLLRMMPNKRYGNLIRYRYVEEKTNEETAELLGMTMDNYYNKHKLAKVQFAAILRKEGLI